jgi:hypothetical protein
VTPLPIILAMGCSYICIPILSLGTACPSSRNFLTIFNQDPNHLNDNSSLDERFKVNRIKRPRKIRPKNVPRFPTLRPSCRRCPSRPPRARTWAPTCCPESWNRFYQTVLAGIHRPTTINNYVNYMLKVRLLYSAIFCCTFAIKS